MKLGQKITVDSFLVRKEIMKGNGTPFKNEWKIWNDINFEAPKEVLVIGVRTLSNGIVFWDNMRIYMPKEYFKALLVVEKLSSKPFYIKYP